MTIGKTITSFMDDLCESSKFAISPTQARDDFTKKHHKELQAHGWELSQRELLKQIKGYLTTSARSDTQLQLNGFSFPRTLTVAVSASADEEECETTYVYVPLRIATVDNLLADESIKAENVQRVQREYDAIVARNAAIREHARSGSERVVDVIARLHRKASA